MNSVYFDRKISKEHCHKLRECLRRKVGNFGEFNIKSSVQGERMAEVSRISTLHSHPTPTSTTPTLAPCPKPTFISARLYFEAKPRTSSVSSENNMLCFIFKIIFTDTTLLLSKLLDAVAAEVIDLNDMKCFLGFTLYVTYGKIQRKFFETVNSIKKKYQYFSAHSHLRDTDISQVRSDLYRAYYCCNILHVRRYRRCVENRKKIARKKKMKKRNVTISLAPISSVRN